jgi:sRNA-binding regulator protein Hfq
MRRIAAGMFAISIGAAIALSPIASNLAYAVDNKKQKTTATVNQKLKGNGKSSLAYGHGIETNGFPQPVQTPTNKNTGAPGSNGKSSKGKSSLAYGHGIETNGFAQPVQTPTK